jgi:hypothetical protein
VAAAAPANHVYDASAERDLMRSIRESCGAEIAEAMGGDRDREALLAAIVANESGGSRQAFRFDPEVLERLRGLLAGTVEEIEGLKKETLEKRLSAEESEAARSELLKKLAGLHGYTMIPGYFTIISKTSLEALTDRSKHFHIAGKRLERFCKKFELDPALHAAALGRCWNTGHPNGRTKSALYSWRLQERIRLYREVEPPATGSEVVPEEKEFPDLS